MTPFAMIHLLQDEHRDRDKYTCPTPTGTSCEHERPHDDVELLGQILKGRTLAGIRYGSAFEFTEWQWIPDDLEAERGPVHRSFSVSFEDARRFASGIKMAKSRMSEVATKG